MTNSCPYSGSISVTSDLVENQIHLEPTSTGTTLLAGPASLLSCPPCFFFRSPSPHQPFLALARSMISSEVGGELALPRAASSQRLPGSLPAPLHPRPLPTSPTAAPAAARAKAASHICWAGSARARGAKEHWPIPCTSAFQGLASPPLHPKGCPASHPGCGDGSLKRLLKSRKLQAQI